MARRHLALAAAITLIAAATLVPAPGPWPHTFWCLRCGGIDPTEFLGNILLFIPLGIALRVAGFRVATSTLAIVGATMAVEALQYFVIVGREGSVRDCITNTMGGLIGYYMQPNAGALWRADRKPSRTLAWSVAAFWVANAAASSMLFRPAASPSTYFGQIAPRFEIWDAFSGSVLSATLNGRPLPDGPLDSTLAALARAPDTVSLAAIVSPGAETSRLAPIAAAVAGSDEIAILAERRGDALFQARVAGQNLGFNAPAVVLAGALARDGREATSAPVTLTGWRRGLEQRLVAQSAAGGSQQASLVLSPSFGWALWWPWDYPNRATLAWMTIAWLAVPVGLMMFWSTRRNDLARSIAPAATAIMGAHVLVPAVLGGGQIASWPEVVGLAAGVVLGFAAGRLRGALTAARHRA